MADDLLGGVFGPGAKPADPLADVFGGTPDHDFTTSPTAPRKVGALEAAVEGNSQAGAQAERDNQAAIDKTAANSATDPTQSKLGYLGHAATSGVESVIAGAGDIADAPVRSARNLWLSIKDAAHQLSYAANAPTLGDALTGDKSAYLQTEAAKDASTPMSRFAESMTRQSQELAQSPDGQKYNQLTYDTADPSQSALLSPVRMVHDMLQSLPSTAAMATTIYLTRGAAAKGYAEAIAAGFTEKEATAIAVKAAGRVASLAGAGGEGVVGGLQQGEQERVQVLDAKNPTKSPVFQAMIRAGVKPADVKQYIATEAGNTAGEAAGAVDAVTNLAEGPILGRIIGEGGPLASRVGKGFLAEGIQEGVQGAGEQVGQNYATKEYVDPSQKLGDQVAENVIASFAVGGLTGGLFAGVGGHAAHPEAQADPLGDVFGADTTEPTAQPGTDALGTSPISKPPVAGRSYGVADAMAELGMSPDEAQSFVSTGKDPRQAATVLEQHGFTPELSQSDQASPIGGDIIAAGKGILATALKDHSPVTKAKANLPMDVVQGLIDEGIPEHIARSAAAGSVAESGNNAGVVNSKSGAFGLGQWLGSRKQGLIDRYGPNPSRADQIKYLAWELKGGDAGGKSVLAAQDETSALNAYIKDFMRPAAGKETDGDLQRGMAALGRAGQAIESLKQEAASLGGDTSTSEPALTVEGTMAQAGVNNDEANPALGEDVTEFSTGQRIDVTQDGKTVPGTVQEVYGEGPSQGVKVALDDGTTFDEEVARARQYGAKLTQPVTPAAPVSNEPASVPDVAVPQSAEPETDPLVSVLGSHVGEPINSEWTQFHPDSGTLGIPRAEMPQIKGEHRGAMVNFLEARGISANDETVPAASLKPTQAEFSQAKADSWDGSDLSINDRKLLVSSDNHVLDGHHQWVKALEKPGANVNVIRLGAPIKELMAAAHEFPSSTTSGGHEDLGPVGPAAGDVQTREMPNVKGGKLSVSIQQTNPSRSNPGITAAADYEVKGYAGGTVRGQGETVKEAMRDLARRWGEHFAEGRTGAASDTQRETARKMHNWLKIEAARKQDGSVGAFTREQAREVAVEAARRGHDNASGNIGDVNYSFGQRVGLQKGPMMTPGKVHIEHRGTVHTFNTKEIQEAAQEKPQGDLFNKADSTAPEHATQGLNDEAANKAIAELQPEPPKEPIADQPTEAPALVAAAEALREKAQPHQDELVAWGQRWAKQGDEYGFINPGLKSADRIIEKLTKEGYQSLDGIKDVARVGFKVTDRNRAADLVVSAQRTFGADNVTDKGWRMVDGDYFDRKLTIAFPDGIKAEVQIVPDAIEQFRHEGGGADLYTKWRSTDAGPEKDALLREMQDGYAKAAAGTSWESLFNELKSASGNSLAAASEESGTPGLVDKPGAERQAPESQTIAQALPDTAPEATSRSSTSNSEKSAIGSNVGNAPQVGNGSKDYGASNKIVTRTQADIARAIIRDKLARQLNSGFDPEMLSAGAQLAAFHLEAGARKFADFAKAIAEDLGTQAVKLKPYLAAWYNGARDLLEGHGVDVSDMDTPETVRAGITSLSNGVDDIGDNGGTNGGTATDQGAEGPDRASDAGERSGDVPGAEGVGEPGQGSDGASEPSGGQLRAGAESGVEPRAASEPEPVAQSDNQRDNAGAERSGNRSAQPSRRVRSTASGTDYRAPAGGLKRSGSWLQTAGRNLDIIELVNKLDSEARPATPEEQQLLAHWTGWGASEMRNKLFGSVDRRTMTINKSYYSGEWGDTIERARELIKGPDLETALQSTQYAHYTSEGVVRGIWDAVGRMGFEGGRILEPGMGIGHFFTAAPAGITDHSTYTGVELDQFSAKIAKYLLPNENVIQGDFTKQAFPDGFFDATIGNPPFAATKILNDPAYKKMRLSLHNYFFVKSLDKVRPGGLLAFVTSRYTMDSLDPKARQFMADRADFVGAIRLPQTAFKENAGTEVVTDVIFMQRRMPGAEPGGVAWLNPKQISVGGSKAMVNEYFAAHPEMVLGKHAFTGSMYSKNELTVEPYASKGSIEKQFAEAAKNLPEGIYTAQPQQNVESLSARTFERDFAPASSKEGGLYVKDGKLHVVSSGSGVPVEAIRETLKPADHAWLKGYVGLRDALKEAQKAQLQDAPDWETKLNALRKEYAKFTKANGRIKEFTSYERSTTDDAGEKSTVVYRRFKWDKLLFDVEAPMVESLERITDAGDIEDGPFLKGRTLNKPVRPKIESVHDALAVTLDELGKLDLPYLAKLAGLSEDDAVRQLGDRVYQTPSGEWQTDDEYLSGDVLKKLEEAQQAAATAPEYQRNVEALLKVQPQPLSYDRIAVKLGAPWIKPETVQQFADEVLGQGDVPITYDVTTAGWNVEGAKARYRRNVTEDFGTSDRSPLELLDAVLNNRSIKVSQKIDGKEVVNPNATAAANEAAKKIADRFKTWLWEDSARTAQYVETYNRSYNNIAPRRFNGDHLTLPGLSANFIPHAHVKRAVWRIIQTGNTYLAHAVGAGKTAEQIIGGQEQRRLGLIKKPMHVVPNHMLKQFSQEFLKLYPAANIIVADEQAFHTGNRQRFLAQAALNDPDAIIITHSAFGKVDTSDAMRGAIIDEMVAELEDAHKDAKDSGAPRHLVSRLEKQIEQLKRRFEGKIGSGKDKLLTFDELGVDFLAVDEAHEFRKLDFATNRQAKGIDPTGSARALDLFIKSQWLEKNNPGRSMVMASGTSVTNTMAELYTVMRFMDMKGLERDHIAAFDAWANMFGEVASGYERNAAGGYEIVERFSKFVNVPELMKRVRNFMDVLSSSQLGDLVTRPKINGGGPQNVITPTSDELDAYMKGALDTRLKRSREWKPSQDQPANPDPVINIITDARLSAIDMRYINPSLPSDPDSKLNEMIGKIAAKHQEYAGLVYTNKDGTKQPRKGAAQIVFSPVGFGEQVAKNRGFDVRGWIDGELQRLGVKKSEIGWMSDANTHAKKDQLQKDVRSGKVRILFGSPKNMGTGLNVQDRLKTLHFLAPPWYPSDVTQPHGRIERQGNQNPDVDINWYATKGTYDSTGWGMVARKQKFIDDAMSGDDSVRTLEDISEINQFEMAAALAAGDDRVIKIASLGGDVERLQRLKNAHADTQRTLRSQISTLKDFELPRLQEELKSLKQAQEARGAPYRQFSMAVDGQSYEKHGEAGEALKAAAQTAMDSTTALERTEIGKLYGEFPISIDATRSGDFQLFVDVGGVPFKAGRTFEEAKNLDGVGITRSLELAVQGITSSVQDTSRRITDAQAQLTAATNKYGAPFPEEAQLNDAIAERNQLQEEMAAETKAKDAKPAPQPIAAQASEESGPPITPEQEVAIKVDLQDQLERLGLADRVSLEVAKRLNLSREDAAAQYVYANRLIQVSLDRTDNPSQTLAHEAIHAMKHLGLFTQTEWEHMTRKAWADDSIREFVERNYPNETLNKRKEEAAAELFARVYSNVRHESFVERAARRIGKFLKAVANAVRKVLGKDVEPSLFDAIASGEIGARQTLYGHLGGEYKTAARVTEPASSESPDFGGETERRWQEANGLQVDGQGIIAKAKQTFAHFIEGWSRHYENLPNSARFSDVKQQLRKLEGAPEAAYEKVVRHLTGLVGDMSPAEYDLFKRKVVLDDLSWEADREHELPFGFTPQTLKAARAKIDPLINANPKLVRAVRERKSFNAKLADQMVEAGILTREQIRNPAYYRHMVLDFARAQIEAAQNGGTILVNGKPVKVRSPYWAKRKGSSLDINTNLLEAEADWMLKAHADIQTASTINWIKASDHNIREQLRARAKSENDAAYADALKANPSAAKDDSRFRQMMGMGYSIVKQALEDDEFMVPDHLQGAADSIIANDKSAAPFPLLSWMMDEKKPGWNGAALILTATGGKKKLMRSLLDRAYADPDDIKGLVQHFKPEGYTDWQPLEGQHFFTGKTVSEHVLDMFVSKLNEADYPGVDKLELERALGAIRPQLVVGGERYTMVLPKELAATLDDFGDKASRNMFLQGVAAIQGKWKQYILINPRRWFKYNFNNMTGDLDAIIAGKPSSILKLPDAFKELWQISRGGQPSDAYKEAIDRGVFQAGITKQEVPDINQFKGLRHLSREKSGTILDKLGVQVVANLWHALKGTTQFRESLFRYAAYLKYREEIAAGKDSKEIGYGGSNPALVDAVEDPADRAALLARELVGDYGDISVFGARMRRYVMPFWSWPEMNTKRYFRLTANAFRVSHARGAATGGLLGAGIAARSAATMTIRMALVFGLINLWNRWLHGDDEDKLDDQQKHQLHLILGHDSQGQVYTLRMQGSLSDVLDELGFSDTVDAFKAWEDGHSSFGDIMKATPKAIINRVGPGNWNPLYMEPIQLALREKLWPDMFQPRTIHDRERDVAQMFSLENEYDWATGKPSQGYGRSWLQSFAYQRDPGEMAYNNTRDLVGQWMKDKEGLDIGRSNISPRSEALRDYKMGLRYGDVPAARQALEEYAKYDGTIKGLKASIKAAAPLKPLPKRDRKAFVQSLNDDQVAQLIEAQKYYEETYLGKKDQ